VTRFLAADGGETFLDGALVTATPAHRAANAGVAI
jgi:hypothetical protein